MQVPSHQDPGHVTVEEKAEQRATRSCQQINGRTAACLSSVQQWPRRSHNWLKLLMTSMLKNVTGCRLRFIPEIVWIPFQP